MSKSMFDVLILGGGPAGLGTAAALAGKDVEVGLLAPTHPPEWPNSYGLWLEDLEELDLVDEPWADLMEMSWKNVAVDLGGESAPKPLGPTYTRVDNSAVRDALQARADRGDVTRVSGWAREVEVGEAGVEVTTRGGRSWRGRLVIDATGHQSKFVTRQSDRAESVAFQSAWGAWIDCEGSPVDFEGMMLMDFRDDFLDGPGEATGVGPRSLPTFLYAMPLGDSGQWFVEETSLAARPPVSFDVLEARLWRRLEHREVHVQEVVETERVRIPMGGALPELDQPVVGIGGAAAMPHPATGYMVTRAWRAAQRLGDEIEQILQLDEGGGGETPVLRRAKRAWRSVWSAEAVRRRRLYNFGLEVMLSLDAVSTRAFFESFFELDEDDWRAYLSGEASPGRLAGVMWRLFRRAPAGVKWRIIRASISSDAVELWRAWQAGNRAELEH